MSSFSLYKFFSERPMIVIAVNLGDTLYYHTPSRRNGDAAGGSTIAKGIGAISASGRIVVAAGGSTKSCCCCCKRSTLNDISSSIIPTRYVVVASLAMLFLLQVVATLERL